MRERSYLRLSAAGAPLVGVVLLVVAWDVALRLSSVRLLPRPWEVMLGILELFARGVLFNHIVSSLFRVTWGFLLAAGVAIPMGFVLGWSGRAGRCLSPFVQVLRPISPLAWIPLAILWFGVGDMSAIFIIFIASVLPLTVAAMSAVRNVPATYVNAGQNFGLGTWQLFLRILLPAATPELFIGLRLTLGISWLVVVAAEMISVNSGLGFLIVDSRNAGNRYDLVMAGMVLIGLIGFLLDKAMARGARMYARHRDLVGEEAT